MIKLRARVKELKAENQGLRAQVARLKEELYWAPQPKAEGGQKLQKAPALIDGI
jgi:cell division protein FtsB